MEPIYIVFVAAGGVFVILFFAFVLVNIETWRRGSETKKNIFKAYSDKNLAKMEYDFAFYDGDLYSRESHSDLAQQVTIDDVFSGEAESMEEANELSRFNPIEDVRDNVLVGHYNPEKLDD